MATAAVEVREVWAAYPQRTRRGRRSSLDRWALRGVDLAIEPGEIVALVGHNGSGKTTLLQVINGIVPVHRGSVTTRGRVVALVDLGAGMHRDLTGRENAVIASVLSGLTRREAVDRLDDIAEFAGLAPEVLESPLGSYSAGMGLRLGFSVAVNCRPDVLLVDELLAVGDAAFQQRCLDRVHELVEGGCAVGVVSHDMDLVREHADRVVMLRRGKVQLEGKPEEVVDAYLERALRGEGVVPLAKAAKRAARRWNRKR